MPVRERVLIAMSGGVDSSVAAARLCAQGYDVVGVTLHLWDYPDDGSVKSRCCAPEDVHDARRVADLLGIPHYAFDRRELFQLADRLSAQRVATGHYARVTRDGEIWQLHRGRDPGKDQSYFLHMLGQEALSKLLFPLGDSDKPEIRAEALRLNLPGAQKGESQELCFVPTGRYDAFVAERADGRLRPGPILNEAGEKVGEHEGVFRFTLGQRKNLGVALGQRAYVVGVDADSATVTLGSVDSLYSSSAELTELALAADVSFPLRCEVQIRYRGRPTPAEVRRVGDAVHVFFDDPQRAVVPGQFAVFYADERVLGGGMIRSALRAQRNLTPVAAPESFA